jgi:hypothetical protein
MRRCPNTLKFELSSFPLALSGTYRIEAIAALRMEDRLRLCKSGLDFSLPMYAQFVGLFNGDMFGDSVSRATFIL